MKKNIKRSIKRSIKITSVLLALVIAFSCVVIPASAKKGKIVLTVLGDSVAYGAYVENQYRYGDVMKNKLTQAGYTVDYVNYAIPKYGSRSIYFDFFEETYAFDNNAYVQLLGAYDFRKDISYEDYISRLKSSDIIMLNVGENDIVAKFYEMRGYDNYYIFYGNETKSKIFQNDINNGNVEWIYTYNSKKEQQYKESFELSLSYYFEKDLQELRKLNPDAQILVNNAFNPYRLAVEAKDGLIDLAKETVTQIKELPKSSSLKELIVNSKKICENIKTVATGADVLAKALMGTSMDNCGGLDISSLNPIEQILYKIQYVRTEMCCIELFDIANEIIEDAVEKYNCTIVDIANSDVCYYMTGDGSHPSIEGHQKIADYCFEALDMEKLG